MVETTKYFIEFCIVIHKINKYKSISLHFAYLLYRGTNLYVDWKQCQQLALHNIHLKKAEM